MTPANEAWIREIAATDSIGTAAKIARICMEEIDQLRARASAESKDPFVSPGLGDAMLIRISEYQSLMQAKERLHTWDCWAYRVVHDDDFAPMPYLPGEITRPVSRRKAGQA